MTYRHITFLLVGTLMIVGVFGFVVMGTTGHMGGACPLPGMGMQDCSTRANSFTMANHHITTVQSFVLAVLTALVVSIGILALGVVLRVTRYIQYFFPFRYSWSDNQKQRFARIIQQYRWLARRRAVDFSTPMGCMKMRDMLT